jgi:DNA polymerase-1
MVHIYQRLKEANFKAKMIIQIHDELVFDVPGEELKTITGMVRERMENVLELEVPIRVQMKMGKNWLEMEEVE